jgi:sugar O-acyltransferase (sialic acid O-acetyltransferase NeuD family)
MSPDPSGSVLRVLILGASGHGKVVADIFLQMGLDVVGFVDENFSKGHFVLGLPVLGRERDLPRLLENKRVEGVFVAVGDNWTRGGVVQRMAGMSLPAPFISAVHPTAVIAPSARIGVGSAVMAGAVIGPDARIGDFAIVNTCASVDHESEVADFASLGPHGSMGGNAYLGAYSAAGQGASIIHGVRVEEHAILGAGAVAVRGIPPLSVALGVPAKVSRQREMGEPYL